MLSHFYWTENQFFAFWVHCRKRNSWTMVQMGSNPLFQDLILDQLMQQTKDLTPFEPSFNHPNKHRPGLVEILLVHIPQANPARPPPPSVQDWVPRSAAWPASPSLQSRLIMCSILYSINQWLCALCSDGSW